MAGHLFTRNMTSAIDPLSAAIRRTLESAPAAPLIEMPGSVWSRRRVCDHSSAIAGALATIRGKAVAVLVADKAAALVCAVGILRSGNFFLALDPEAPDAAHRAAVERVRPAAVVTGGGLWDAARLLGVGVEVDSDALSGGVTGVDWVGGVDGLGIFFSSGSTGRPSAVLFSRAATWAAVQNHVASLGVAREDRLSLLSPLSSAASASNFFASLITGACLLPFDPSGKGFDKMGAWVKEMRPTIVHGIPGLITAFAESSAPHCFDSVRALKFGGEPLRRASLAPIPAAFPKCRLAVNGLGATETNGNICHFAFDPSAPPGGATSVPIGRPLPGFDIRIASDTDRPAGAHEAGPLEVRSIHPWPQAWIGPEQVASPPVPGTWIQTGDLIRWDDAGNLLHLGRRDERIKLGGVWVSLHDVEGALRNIPGIRDAACVLPDREGGRHAAFIEWKAEPVPVRELRKALRASLHPAAIPAVFIQNERLPKLPNGKIDRRALRTGWNGTGEKQNARTPRIHDPVEFRLAGLWKAALNTSRAAPDDDFFENGGDSLAAAALFAAIHKYWKIDLPLSTLIEAPTLRLLADKLRAGEDTSGDIVAIPFQLGGSNPPVFCVPGAGGEALSLRSLAEHLGTHHPFFAFQHQGLNGSRPYLREIGEMAERFLSALLELCPQGPFILMGSSFGGVVAFEMARRLDARGRPPHMLALLDSRGGSYPTRRKDLPLKYWPLAPFCRVFPDAMEPGMPVRTFAGKLLSRVALRALARIELAFGFRMRIRYHIRFPHLREACSIARRRFRPVAWGGRTHLFRAALQPPAAIFEEDPLLGWGGIAPDLKIHPVPGGHGQHLRDPHVAGLAEALRAVIESDWHATTCK